VGNDAGRLAWVRLGGVEGGPDRGVVVAVALDRVPAEGPELSGRVVDRLGPREAAGSGQPNCGRRL
jgi:hypothetical protein